MLKELIVKQVNEMMEEIEKNSNNVSSDLVEKIENLLKLVSTDSSNIRKDENTDEIIEVVYADHKDNLDAYKKELNDIKALLTLQHDMDLQLAQLSISQQEFINSFVEKTKEIFKEMQQSIEESKKDTAATNRINKYNKILSKVESNEALYNDDIYEIMDIIKELPAKDRLQLYAELAKYSNNSEVKVSITDTKITKAGSILDVEERFGSTSRLSPDKVEKSKEVIRENENEVLKFINLENISSIVNALEAKGIYEKFSPDDLVVLVLYADEKSINDAYDDFVKHNLITDDEIYKTPSFWCKQKSSRDKTSNKNDEFLESGTDGPRKTYRLKQRATQTSRAELFKIIDFFKEKGVDITDPDIRSKKAKTSSLTQVLECYNVYQAYNINANKPSEFSYHNVQQHADSMIEAGLLRYEKSEDNRCNLVNNSPSKLNSPTKNLILLYQSLYSKKLSGSDYDDDFRWENLFSTKKTSAKKAYLSHDEILKQVEEKHLDTESGIKSYMKENNLIITGSDNFKYYDEMTKIVSRNGFVPIDPNIEQYPFIRELDESFRTPGNSLAYTFENSTTISRPKVLRIYQLLQSSPFTEEEIRFFAITYNTYIDKNNYQRIKDYAKIERGSAR